MGKTNKSIKGLTKHHLVPKSRGGHGKMYNILYIPTDKHRAWHFLFGNMTIPEVIKYLLTLKGGMKWSPRP